jgi:glycosyltransferase involved in cell wall biosynthesis
MSPISASSAVAALVPAWQSAGFIQPTLDCLSAQTYGNFKVIVSVDLCDDDTYAVCVAHAGRDPRFQVVRQERRLGYVGNCNFLLDQTNADYVLLAFHDDILAPTYITRLAEVLDARPEVVLSFSDVHLTGADGRQQHCQYTQLEGVRERARRGLIVARGEGHWWLPNRGLFRLDDARRINGLKTHGAGEFKADWPWLFHMSLLGEFARVPQTLCYKFFKSSSISLQWKFSKQQEFWVRVACMRELWNSELSLKEKLKMAPHLVKWIRWTLTTRFIT